MRVLTLDEAELVQESSRSDVDLPEIIDPASGIPEVIGREFEAFLILTPLNIRSGLADFFRTIIDNDPNKVATRDEILTDFLDEEEKNSLEMQKVYESFTSYYDQVREGVISSLDGFEDLKEVAWLQEALTNSLGNIISDRDRHMLNFAALQVLRVRHDSGRSQTSLDSLQQWVETLVEYD